MEKYIFKTIASRIKKNFSQPWLPGKIVNTTGTCFSVSNGGEKCLISCAHTVFGSEIVECSKTYPSENFLCYPKWISDTLDIATLLRSEKVDNQLNSFELNDHTICQFPKFTEQIFIVGFSSESNYLKILGGNITNIVECRYMSGLKNIAYETNIKISEGYSGSPAVNQRNELIGICFSKKNECANIIPVSLIMQHLKLREKCVCDWTDSSKKIIEIDGYPVNNDKSVILNGMAVPYVHIVRLKTPGEIINIKYVTSIATLQASQLSPKPVPMTYKHIKNEYLILGGFVFLQLNGYLLRDFKNILDDNKETVVLGSIIKTSATQNFNYHNLVLQSVDDANPTNLKELLALCVGKRLFTFTSGLAKTIDCDEALQISENFIKKFISADWKQISDD